MEFPFYYTAKKTISLSYFNSVEAYYKHKPSFFMIYDTIFLSFVYFSDK